MATKKIPKPRLYFKVSTTAPTDHRDLWFDPSDCIKYWDGSTWAPMPTWGYPVPSGTVFMWSGAVADIPYGYVLCDGQNGTPDLRNKFVIGAGSSYSPGATGGAATHTHGVPYATRVYNNSSHEWESMSPDHWGYSSSSWFYGLNYLPQTSECVTGSASSLPPFYALCYIMKT